VPAALAGWIEEPPNLERPLDLALALLVDDLTDRHIQHPNDLTFGDLMTAMSDGSTIAVLHAKYRHVQAKRTFSRKASVKLQLGVPL
ncbi:MAG: hypothetical protein L0221_09445, partial [Chloroflexi bacterium]|nr:hypothetical protein [Chloroflexota bacterium]